jgi:hypothetical protein
VRKEEEKGPSPFLVGLIAFAVVFVLLGGLALYFLGSG